MVYGIKFSSWDEFTMNSTAYQFRTCLTRDFSYIHQHTSAQKEGESARTHEQTWNVYMPEQMEIICPDTNH